MGTLEWAPWGMCGAQARLANGEIAIVDGFQRGNTSGFALTYLWGKYEFSSRADAYQAAELLNTALFIENNFNEAQTGH